PARRHPCPRGQLLDPVRDGLGQWETVDATQRRRQRGQHSLLVGWYERLEQVQRQRLTRDERVARERQAGGGLLPDVREAWDRHRQLPSQLREQGDLAAEGA